ncbi:thioredoxin family protein [Oceanobacillus kimchii]|uniref:Thioredoxin-like fold domain-containing protein n=1 Tax=Oceanobacillus kimchii TaxID=746691 RepID=A0ABQ5THB2_9BACI|nr:thioredoxin family protein [Oceanobacillus kimchii]GLO66263.1 hypothetical protein MACH08_20470 [Oceanobacillus kimchii]
MIIKVEKNGCTPCKMVGQLLDASEKDYVTENIDENPEIINKYDIMSVPTVIKFDSEGNEVSRVVGFNPEKLELLKGE